MGGERVTAELTHDIDVEGGHRVSDLIMSHQGVLSGVFLSHIVDRYNRLVLVKINVDTVK